MRPQLVPSQGSGGGGVNAAISYAIEALIRAQSTLSTVFEDDPHDLCDPSRKPFLRQQYAELQVAIGELRRAQSDG